MAGPPTSDPIATGPLEAGTVLQNRYQIERLVGGGGMGMVYLARDQRLANRPCAIKEMVDHFIDPQQRIEANEYFAREADTLAQLKHVAIPAITDRFDHRNRHYLVMEYIEGRNLEEEIAASGGGPLSEGLVIDIGRQLCDVLGYLHGLTPPIIYRDMKPSNVMLTPRGRVVLVDFGIARLFRAARKGTMIGTLGFAPPEQYQGAVDPRSDIYSLGATLHYVLTGRDPEKFPPFSFPPVRNLRPDVSSNLAGALDRALAYEVDGRPQSIQEFRDMMLYGHGLTAGGQDVSGRSGTDDLVLPPEHSYTGAIPHRRRNPVRRAIGITAVVLILGGGAFGATYLYSNPALQQQLGVQGYINSLPWKHQQLIAEARSHPLDFQRMTLTLSTRDGTPLSKPQASFTDNELNEARYLQWNASFTNRLAGLAGINDKIDARFFDPAGHRIAMSTVSRFVGPADKAVDFSGVALMPDFSSMPPGNYKVALFSNDQLLAEQRFAVTQDLAARTKAAAAATAAAAEVRTEAAKRTADEKRLAMLAERKRRPLDLVTIKFVNTTKSGTELSRPSTSFKVSKVLFVGWQISFSNRLFGLEANEYRVDAAYIAPSGGTLGSVDDIQVVPRTKRSVTFSGRVGNSAGGAFLPGVYTVNFYLNGQYFAQRKFRVVEDGPPPTAGYSTSSASSGVSGGAMGGSFPPLDSPLLARGRINGIGGHDNVAMELRLRPQPNGFLHGELVINQPGYGPTSIEGFVRGNRLQFQVPYGTETYYFQGTRASDHLSGTFESTPSGSRGTWSTVAN
ncbi:MAG TPA: serine/threonine-protein kinase [Candidatus Binataceae bacterium]|nr:serine/threonine-protein kinase [Candidatus Binataceae bacterium]